MARAHFSDVAIDPTGAFLDNAKITARLRGSTTLADIFATETTTTPLDNPYYVTDGVVSHWADAGAYDVTIEDAGSPPRVQARTIGWGAVPGVQGGIPGALIEDASVQNAKLASGIDGAKLVAGSVANAQLAASGIDAGKLTTGTLPSARIAASSIARSQLAADALVDAIGGYDIGDQYGMFNGPWDGNQKQITLPTAGKWLILAQATGYGTAGGMAYIDILFGGTILGASQLFINNTGVHKTFPMVGRVLTMAAGTHWVYLGHGGGNNIIASDSNDRAWAVAIKVSG